MRPNNSSKRRQFTRLPFKGRARISDGETKRECELVDISLKGVLLRQLEGITLTVGEVYTIDVFLGRHAAMITMRTKAVHVSSTLAGFRWDKMDIESFSHLHRLLELNLGDPSLMERELRALGKRA